MSSKMAVHLKDTFLYFAYGSNLLKTRIRINNPTAEFIGIGKLEDHQLNFIQYSENWRGSSATIIPNKNSYVWGAIWRLHNKDMASLDRQEGVETNWYFPKTVDIIISDTEKVLCRTYQQTINPPVREPNEEIPLERRPSITYLDCIIKGAIECNLPEEYIKELRKIPHNGQKASPEMLEKLNMQEGVDKKIYYPKHVEVLTPYMGTFVCRVYIQKLNPLPMGDNDTIPVENWTSWTYKEIIILGAMEHELPEYYISNLEKIKNNGERGCLKIATLLMRYAKEQPCPCSLPRKKYKPPSLDLRELREKKKKVTRFQ